MKYKVYRHYFFRSLKKDLSKILSIVAIVSLGIGFLIGLLSCTPDLYKSVNNYLKDVSYQDLILKSNVGFHPKTIEYLHQNIDDIQKMNCKTEVEEKVEITNSSIYAHIVYQPMDDNLSLVDGRMPLSKNECVVLSGNVNLMENYTEVNFYKENQKITYQVVGKVHDPSYIIKEEIYSQSDNNRVQTIIYLDSAYDNEYVSFDNITDIAISFTSLKSVDVFSKSYKDKMNDKIQKIEKMIHNDEVNRLNYTYILEEKIKDEMIVQFKNMGYNDEQIEKMFAMEMLQNQLKESTQQQLEETISTVRPQIYLLSHDEIAALTTFKSNAEKVNLIASIFPVFFFAIAMLVTLSSFSRIVSKDKMEIAALRANGYPRYRIYEKYLVCGFLSTLVGCILGTLGGIFLLPYIIYTIYSTMYVLPPIQFTFQSIYIFSISLLMIVFVLLVIYFVVRRYNQKHIANLLVDNDIKTGKKILLEKIPFIWNHLKFKMKSMFRNVFRFKRNLIMMILGVGGCSAILLTGFGLNNSLNVLTKNQFEDIFHYNLILQTDESKIEDVESQENIFYITDGKVNQNKEYKVSFISGSEQLNQFITFKDNNDDNVYFTNSSCFITRQIADEFNLQENDLITYTFDDFTYNFTINKIVNNYVGNYLYVGKDLIANEDFKNYHAIMAYKDFTNTSEETWFASLSEKYVIKNRVYTNQYKKTYDLLVDNLRSVVALLIIISGLLAVIVIYNLVDINISERIKEMATLRVIGYKKSEVIMYIFREIFLMSLFGFVIGIVFGILLHRFIIHSIASPGLVFGLSIKPLSYLYTGLLTVCFSLVVVVIFSPKIIKINMSEALKAPE